MRSHPPPASISSSPPPSRHDRAVSAAGPTLDQQHHRHGTVRARRTSPTWQPPLPWPSPAESILPEPALHQAAQLHAPVACGCRATYRLRPQFTPLRECSIMD
jgi:hypothetical protein